MRIVIDLVNCEKSPLLLYLEEGTFHKELGGSWLSHSSFGRYKP